MNKAYFVKLLNDLIIPDLPENNRALASRIFAAKYQEIVKTVSNSESITAELNKITKPYFSDSTNSEWKYVMCNIYVLKKIGDIVGDPYNKELLSVKEMGTIKRSIADLIRIGIRTKLLPALPFYINEIYLWTNDMFYSYHVLKCTTFALCQFLKNDYLRGLILSNFLRFILIGLYQVAYCPLSKTIDWSSKEDIHTQLLNEKEIAVNLLKKLKESIYPTIYIRETMVIYRQEVPPWCRKELSKTLTSIMLSKNGVEKVAVSLFDGTDSDRTRIWKSLDLLFRMIAGFKNKPDLMRNLCQQVVNLAYNTDKNSVFFERLFVACTKNFYLEDEAFSKEVFLSKVGIFLYQFTQKHHEIPQGDCTNHITKNVRLLYSIFIEKVAEGPCLPINLLNRILDVIFRIYSLTINTAIDSINSEVKELLLKYFNDCPENDDVVFDCLLFGIDHCTVFPIRKDLIMETDQDKIIIKTCSDEEDMLALKMSQNLLKLLENKSKLQARLFRYLLRCLVHRETYFDESQEKFLTAENQIMNGDFERRLVVFQTLSELAENNFVQKEIIDSPQEIIDFVKNVLERTIETNTHKTTEYESSGFQTVFTVIMILNALIENYSKQKLVMFGVLRNPLQTINNETNHNELKHLIEKILYSIEVKENDNFDSDAKKAQSQLDIILEDICDPLLPVRGHGLMALKKLVEKKDADVMNKKQYILTIFQQNLKNEDSYIYLNAVDGLAAMANVFPDTVVNALCEEFSDFNKGGDDGHEVRIKLGEVLVRVTKALGDLAPKYKAVLLNTFLVGAKDDDHLIRASSLSNLGEICGVLGYKLGTVITEVLVCVHAIIATDKAVEARRAAVTVIRQLFSGLESEMIAFLKDEILTIYRTLKEIYSHDKDDVMRLQAQLALEELNDNMKEFVFPKPQLNMEKKIIMLD